MHTTKSLEEKIGIKSPIIQAPMAGGPTSLELIQSVASAGCLGMLGAGYTPPIALKEQLKSLADHNKGSWGVNLFLPPNSIGVAHPSNEFSRILKKHYQSLGLTYSESIDYKDNFSEQLDIAIQAKPRVITFTFGAPKQTDIEQCHAAGIIVGCNATQISEVKLLDTLPIDFIVVQGYEAGGHRASFLHPEKNIGLISLLTQARRHTEKSLIASGGISDGYGMAAAISGGATAVQLGSAFLVASESGAAIEWKDAVANSNDSDTVITKVFSGRNARGIENDFIRSFEGDESGVADYPIHNSLTKAMRQKAKEAKDTSRMSLWCGQSGSLCTPGSAKDIVQRIQSEYKKAIERLPDCV